MPVSIQNCQGISVRPLRLRRLAQRALRALKVRGELSLALVDDAQMRALNRQYRRHDRTTDVLAFPQGECGLIGDVVLSVETIARRNHATAGVVRRVERDLDRCVLHGILHLMGWDHHTEVTRRAMRRRERALWEETWGSEVSGTA